MQTEPAEDSLGDFLASLGVESPQHVPVELRVEPVLGDEQLAVHVSDHAYIFHLLEVVRADWSLAPSITLLVQIVNVNLLVHALQVDDACLHRDFCSLLRVSLERNISN